MVLPGVAVAAVGLQGHIGGPETGFRRQPFGHVGFLAAGFVAIDQPGGFGHHQRGGFEAGSRLGKRKGDPLVLADGPAKDLPLPGVAHRPAQRGAADADGLRRDEDSLGVEAIEQVVKAFALLTDAIRHGNRQIVVDNLASRDRIAAELGNRRDADFGALQFGEQQGHAIGSALDFFPGRGPRQQHDALAMGGLGGPDLAAAHDVAAAFAAGEGADRRGVGAGVWFGDAESHMQRAAGDIRQVFFPHGIRPVLDQWMDAEHRQMHRRGAVHRGPGCGDFLKQYRGFADAPAGPAPALGNRRADPAGGGNGIVEFPGKLGEPVAFFPVFVGKARAQLRHRFADHALFFGFAVVIHQLSGVMPARARTRRARLRCGTSAIRPLKRKAMRPCRRCSSARASSSRASAISASPGVNASLTISI